MFSGWVHGYWGFSRLFGVNLSQVLVSFSVSFTVGADVKRVEFEVRFLHESVQVRFMSKVATLCGW